MRASISPNLNANNFENYRKIVLKPPKDYARLSCMSDFWNTRCVRPPEGNPLVSETCISARAVLQGALVKGARKMERD